MKTRILRLACFAVIAVVTLYFFARHFRPTSPGNSIPSDAAAVSSGTAISAAVALPAGVSSNAVSSNPNQISGRVTNSVINPYASALREPGKSKRSWDADFLKSHQSAAIGDPIRFELTENRMASGTIHIAQYRDGELTYLSGELSEPESGKFFFLTPPAGGVAGKAVGVVEFPGSQTAYRIEPTGPNGDPELWQRRLDEVLCVGLPQPIAAFASTNQTMEMPPLRPDAGPNLVPSYNSNIISLQSFPGSPAVLLLDFFGGYTPTWGGVNYVKPANVNNSTIRDLWKRVAEDYMPFNINVTTDIKVYQAAPATSRQRCCFTDTPITPAGVAYFGSWNWGNDTPCWSVYTIGKNGAEVGAHEPGHTLGLSHQTQGDLTGTTNEYYAGHGSGVTGWAPIMGVGYYQPLSTWAKGEYQYANNQQDELTVITTQNNNVTYRTDDTGSTLAASRYLEVYSDFAAMAEGVIERTGDTDAFQFTTSGGQVSLTVSPVGDWADLALMATLADSTDTIIASNNVQSTVSATITTNLPSGTYTFRVTGAGKNNPLNTGFSSYASLGYYSIAGSVAGGRLSTRLSLMEHSPSGTIVGTVPASNPTDTLDYFILSGNTGNTFSIDTNGVVTVASNTLLDYNQLATNTVMPVQFELFVNITNVSNPGLTELNRRVVISVLSSSLNYPIAATGYNAGVIVPYNATPGVPKATAFDIPNGYCFYQAGLNGNGQVGGTGGAQGLPGNGIVLSLADNTTFQLGPYGGTNALMMGNTYPTYGTLVLATPRAYNSIAILASSANGGGLGTFVLNFTNGTKSQVFNFNAQDWYNVVTNVGSQGFGRLKLGQATLNTENPGANNPNLYHTTLNLAALGLNQTIASITFTNPPVTGSRSSGVFALSGSPMPPQVIISQQPSSATNNNPAQSSTFSVVAMGTPPLGYQWYSGSPGSGTLLNGKTGNSLVITPVQTNDAGNYFVVVTNGSSAATSSVAALTVYRAPQITQQPSPTSLFLFASQTATLSVAANAAVPVNYYWNTNGTFLPSATSATLTLANLQVSKSANYTVIVSNAFGTATSSVVSLTVTTPNYPFAQLVLADRPVGFWRLDELSGTIAHDYASGKNGTYTNAQLGQAGNNLIDTHKAARFGILSSVNSYVGGIPIDFATTTNALFSVEAWVKGSAQTTDAGLVTKGTGAGGEQFNLDCGSGGSHAFRFFVRDAGGGVHLANGSIAPNGLWHHVVGVCNQTNGLVILYVDGVSNASGTITAGSGLLSSSNPLSIGSRQTGTTAYDHQFVGTMEEVAIYNYALSPLQVQAHFSAVTNRPPIFATDPFSKPAANAGQAYTGSIATNAADPNGDAITFSKVSGPGWLTVAGNGSLSGTPFSSAAGTNSFLVRATDSSSLSSDATMNIAVMPAPPIIASVTIQGTNLALSWIGGIAPYQIEMTTDLAAPAWAPFSGPTSATSLLVSPTNDAAFYRIFGQ